MWKSGTGCLLFTNLRMLPHIRTLSSHISEFIAMYKTIAPFSQQGLEKLNVELTKYYFRSTSHRDKDSLQLSSIG